MLSQNTVVISFFYYPFFNISCCNFKRNKCTPFDLTEAEAELVLVIV